MRKIEICVGSSCFLKGAYDVLDAFTALARQHGLQKDVTISAAFCKERCREGVSVEIDGTVHSVPDIDSARCLFARLFLDDQEAAP